MSEERELQNQLDDLEVVAEKLVLTLRNRQDYEDFEWWCVLEEVVNDIKNFDCTVLKDQFEPPF